MRVLVTGGAGYIGSHTCKALALAGHQPIVIDNLSQGNAGAVKWGPFLQGDLSNQDLIRAALDKHRIEAVVHLAAHAYVGESNHNPRKYFRNNVVNSMNLLDAMAHEGVSDLVFSSSCATYGNPQQLPITEEHRQEPVNPYGDSKLIVERALRWYGNAYGLRSICLRYFNAAGCDPEGELGEEHDPETHVIPLIIQAASGNSAYFEVFGTDYPTADGTAIRDFVHVSDIADGHVAALAYLAAGGQNNSFNLGAGTGHSVLELIRMVESTLEMPVPVRYSPRREGDPAHLVADVHKAQKFLGWHAKRSDLQNIIRTAADYFCRVRVESASA